MAAAIVQMFEGVDAEIEHYGTLPQEVREAILASRKASEALASEYEGLFRQLSGSGYWLGHRAGESSRAGHQQVHDA